MSIKTTEETDTERTSSSIIEKLKQRMRTENPHGLMRRDTHSKMYGVVKAEFSVEPNLPPELAYGLFSQAQTFQAWIRFSNQSTHIQNDYQRDIRGMAVKLMNVPGAKLIDPDTAISTHDFVLISPPRFLAQSLKEFEHMLSALQGNLWQKFVFFGTHLKLVWVLIRSMIRIANPLQTQYFSTTPYALGPNAVKYSCRPVLRAKDAIPKQPSQDYLRQAMVKQLAVDEAYFDFCVQLQINDSLMPIENPQKTWDEKVSPFRKVASIRILRQDFDDEAHHKFGENLTFNPWRALEAHRPLGEINRARLTIYQAISGFRHASNQSPNLEPNSWELPEK